MAKDKVETFTDRINRLTEHMRDEELAKTTGLGYWGVRRIREGSTQTLKLEAGLRLAKELGISPWYIATGKSDPDEATKPESRPEAIEEALLALPAILEAQRLLQTEVAGLNDRFAEILDVAPIIAAKKPTRDKRKKDG